MRDRFGVTRLCCEEDFDCCEFCSSECSDCVRLNIGPGVTTQDGCNCDFYQNTSYRLLRDPTDLCLFTGVVCVPGDITCARVAATLRISPHSAGTIRFDLDMGPLGQWFHFIPASSVSCIDGVAKPLSQTVPGDGTHPCNFDGAVIDVQLTNSPTLCPGGTVNPDDCPLCECCENLPFRKMLVDFGVQAGLVNNNCNRCSVYGRGSYLLEPQPNCSFQFTECDICQVFDPGGAAFNLNHQIRLTAGTQEPSGLCFWELRVDSTPPVCGRPLPPGLIFPPFAVYVTATGFSPGNCPPAPMTLFLVNSDEGAPYCSGSFPQVITVTPQ